jgi:hypothetical protein
MSSRSPVLPYPDAAWSIVLNAEISGYSREEIERRCKHCGPIYYKTRRRRREPLDTYHDAHWILPRCLQIETDGDDSGSICLDCVVEFAASVPAVPADPCPGPDCPRCRGEACDQHPDTTCDCDTDDRHHPDHTEEYSGLAIPGYGSLKETKS